ncbi:MAG TPA: flagellar assembly protein FliX [Azospirillaceae bacterium]|nr:flagellar assembly protein FliX [Azospirillaceae bacterium]
MKIEGPGSLRPGQVRKAPRSGSGSDFLSHIQGEGDQAKGVGAPQTAMAVSPLIALQEVDDSLAGRRKARQRAEDILDRLDELRMGILMGAFPREKLVELVRIVQARRQGVDDPRLQEVLDEIDLRAQVEIAKLTQAG